MFYIPVRSETIFLSQKETKRPLFLIPAEEKDLNLLSGHLISL